MNTTFPIHQVIETHIDVAGQQFLVTVGSWPDEVDGSPWAKELVPFHIQDWLPEYGTQAEIFLSSSPEWGGAGPPKPSARHRWNPVALEWHLPVSAMRSVKDAQWDAVKKSRSIAESAGFDWGGGRFQSGAVSQQRINSKALLATLDAGFSEEWILSDNTVMTLSASDMVSVGLALGTHMAIQFKKSQVLRAEIEAATTIDDVLAVCWSVQ